tara:strand:+ start:45671 stop:45850 length:180 start_codon:yes stop_codon:yes gene_type:complete
MKITFAREMEQLVFAVCSLCESNRPVGKQEMDFGVFYQAKTDNYGGADLILRGLCCYSR